MKNKNKTFKNKKGFCYLLYFACQLAGGCGMSKTKKIKAFLVCGFQHPDYSKRQTRTSTLRLTVSQRRCTTVFVKKNAITSPLRNISQYCISQYKTQFKYLYTDAADDREYEPFCESCSTRRCRN